MLGGGSSHQSQHSLRFVVPASQRLVELIAQRRAKCLPTGTATYVADVTAATYRVQWCSWEGLALPRSVVPGELGQHGVVGGQLGVVVAFGRAVQPSGGSLVAARPLHK